MRRIRPVMVLVGALTAVHACSKTTQPATPVSPSCNFAVTSQTTGFGADGGTGTARVTTTSSCSWNAASQADWIRVDVSSHTGSGDVSFTVAASDQPAERSGALTIATQSVSISQAASASAPLPCDLALSVDPDDFERDGGNGVVRISARAGCTWTINKDASWLTIEGPTQGSGPAAVKVVAAANDDVSSRRASIIVGDKTAVVSQPGQGDCTFAVNPVFVVIEKEAKSGDVSVTTARGCRWSSSTEAPWLHLDQASISGPGRLTYHADANPGGSSGNPPRQAPIKIRWQTPTAGQNVLVTQAGECSVALSLHAGPGTQAGDTLTADAGGGAFHFFVLTDPFANCPWTVTGADAWISLVFPPGRSGNGDGDIDFTVAPNPSTEARQTALTVGGRRLTVVQKGR